MPSLGGAGGGGAAGGGDGGGRLREPFLQLRDPAFRNKSTIRALASAPGVDFPEVLRGWSSLGGLLLNRGYRCCPSPGDPSPAGKAYFSGGYNTKRHGSRTAGTIDGTEWVGPWNDLAFGFYKVAKFYYGPGFHEPATSGEVLLNKDVWDEMTDSEKALIEAAIQAEAFRESAEFSASNADSLKVLVEEHGVEVRSFSPELFAEIKKVAAEVVAEVGESDEVTKKVYDSYMTFLDKAIGWSKLSEQGYLNARSPV